MERRKRIKDYIITLCAVLGLGIFVLTGCQLKKEYTVSFNTCTNLQTNKVKDRSVKAGAKVSKPNVYIADDEYSYYLVTGWYTDTEYTKEWNFDKDVVESDMVLYAKWEKQFFVRYFVSNSVEPRLGVYLMDGEKAQKQDYIVPGYQTLGYYADPGYSIPFDFDQPITKDTDIYIRVSDSFWWDGKSIAENFSIEQATGEKSTLGEITYVENGEDSYARVDFGFSERADSRISVFPGLDMTKSQIVTIKYKNLGNTPGFRIFWTVNYEDGSVSGQDGDDRTWDYGEVEIKKGMSEDDDWATLTIDMGKLSIINGASQWAGGKILNMFRIDSMYCEGMDEEFVDNIILFKEISFAPGPDHVSKDSVNIVSDNVFEVMDASTAQQSPAKGYVFPKDRAKSQPKQGTKQYSMTDCLTYLFPYGTKQGLVSYDMSSLKVDMKSNQMLYIRYKNEGHGTRLTVRYHTTDGVSGEQTVTMKKKMEVYGMLAISMLNDEDWSGTLKSIDLIYNKKDTNNVLSVQSIYLSPFKATDLPGINFVDDKCAGFKSNNTYKILFDSKSGASYVEMLSDSVTLLKNVSIDTSVYSSIELGYSVPTAGVDSIEVGYQIGGKWYTDTIEKVKRTSGFETASFELQKKGLVTKMRIVLNGKGKLSLRALQFKSDAEYALDMSDGKYISECYNTMWSIDYGVDYDSVRGAAMLTGGASLESRCLFYLGASGYMKNVRLDSANKKVYVCYNNPGEARMAALNVYYAGSDNTTGSGMAGDDGSVSETKGVGTTAMLKGNMKEGEWAVAVFDFSSLNLFSSNRNATMVSFAPGGDIYLRSIVLK